MSLSCLRASTHPPTGHVAAAREPSSAIGYDGVALVVEHVRVLPQLLGERARFRVLIEPCLALQSLAEPCTQLSRLPPSPLPSLLPASSFSPSSPSPPLSPRPSSLSPLPPSASPMRRLRRPHSVSCSPRWSARASASMCSNCYQMRSAVPYGSAIGWNYASGGASARHSLQRQRVGGARACVALVVSPMVPS